MSELRSSLDDYLRLRRSLGYKLERAGELLDDFVDSMDSAGERTVTVSLALDWATLSSDAGARWRAQRLGVVRGFTRYLLAFNPGTEVPSVGLLPSGRTRPAPFLYSEADIAALMAAARGVGQPLRSATLEAVIGLLATTGLRVGEVLRLDCQDVDLSHGVLKVLNSKRGRSRLVPLHPSTVEALKVYSSRRSELLAQPGSASFFISRRGTRLGSGNLSVAFNQALRRAGLPPRVRNVGPRLGDFRHSFAVRTMLDWYRDGADVMAQLPLLSTFLGHVSPASTYWYLSASPELFAAAAARLDPTLGSLS
jgi:integrase/recombinase XerD